MNEEMPLAAAGGATQMGVEAGARYGMSRTSRSKRG